MSLERQFRRREDLRLGLKPPKVLDKYNDAQKDIFLHATKGYRKMSPKRSVATRITAEIRQGHQYSMQEIQEELARVK